MTKKDYIIIAKAINEMYLGHKDWVRNLEQVGNKFAETLKADNPRFDTERFLTACGINK